MRRFRRRGFARTRRPRDEIWSPFVFNCNGTPVVLSCVSSGSFFQFLSSSDWQPDAAADVAYDHAMLKRLLFTFTWNASSEDLGGAFIWGLFRLDRNVVAGDLGSLWAPGPWGGYDCLWGPHVQSLQSFAANPITVDLQTKRRLSSNDVLVLVMQGTAGIDSMLTWIGGRARIDRMTR